MKISYMLPPNFAAINRAFNVRGKPVIFCYGDTIHNPRRTKISDALIAHESVHSRQQGADPAGWWVKYIADPKFRFDQELPAHRAEFRVLCGNSKALDAIAHRLASPLYGSLTDVDTARRLILHGQEDTASNTVSSGQ